MNVEHSVEIIPGKGKGLVARQFIPKGHVIWTPDHPDLDLKKFGSRQEVESYLKTLSKEDVAFFLNHAWMDETDKKVWYCNGDNGSYFNHSKTQNNCETNGKNTVAARDIKAGEELVDDYSKYAPLSTMKWFEDLTHEYGVESIQDTVDLVHRIETDNSDTQSHSRSPVKSGRNINTDSSDKNNAIKQQTNVRKATDYVWGGIAATSAVALVWILWNRNTASKNPTPDRA